jgi:hypothetical protein
MQGYAGPVQQGDMVVRANEVSPGITSLLAKQNRKGAQGIYELPSAKQPIPNYYNMALDNVQNEIRTAAQTVNAMAPEGERLAYINPQEEGILRLLGGSGEPEPVTGIPSFAIGAGGSVYGKKVPSSRPRTNSGFQGSIGGGGGGNRGNVTTTAPRSTGATMATSPETGGRQTYYATDPVSAMQVAKAREAASRQRSGTSFTTPEQAVAAEPQLSTFAQMGMEGAEKEKGFFEKLFENTLLGKAVGFITKPIQDYNFNWYMENVDPEMGKKFKQLSEKEQQALKDNPYLVPGYEDYWEGRRKQMMEEQAERSRGGDRSPAPVVAEEVEEEVAEEEELPYFSFYRRFKQPMTYEDIIKRAYEGTTSPLLETFEEAKEREQE